LGVRRRGDYDVADGVLEREGGVLKEEK